MKTVNKIVIGVATTLGLGLGIASVHAQQGPMGNGMGPGMMRGQMMLQYPHRFVHLKS